MFLDWQPPELLGCQRSLSSPLSPHCALLSSLVLQHRVLGSDFGKTMGAKHDVFNSYDTRVLACSYHLSQGTEESWPELRGFLLTNATCLSDS